MDYLALKQAIIDWNEEEELQEHVDDFIRAAELRIFREVDLEIFRAHVKTQVNVGDPYLTMPAGSDIIIRDIQIIDQSNRRQLLLRKHQSFIRDFWPDDTQTDTPRYYARWLYNVVLIGPTPDFPYALEMEVSRLPTSIVPISPALNNTSWLGDNAWDALLAGAMIEALAYIKANNEAVMPVGNSPPGVWPQKYLDAITRLGVQEKRERIDDFRSKEPR